MWAPFQGFRSFFFNLSSRTGPIQETATMLEKVMRILCTNTYICIAKHSNSIWGCLEIWPIFYLYNSKWYKKIKTSGFIEKNFFFVISLKKNVKAFSFREYFYLRASWEVNRNEEFFFFVKFRGRTKFFLGRLSWGD